MEKRGEEMTNEEVAFTKRGNATVHSARHFDCLPKPTIKTQLVLIKNLLYQTAFINDQKIFR